MENQRFLLPELIDAVFECLQKCDLYRCIQVNREFNAHAIPFLYRTVELYFQAPHWYKKAKQQETEVWSQLCCYPELLSHIRQLKVHVLPTPHDRRRGNVETTPRFEKRVEYILREGRNVRTFELHDFPPGGDVPLHPDFEFDGRLVTLDIRMALAAQHIFNVLDALEGYREITLDLWNVNLEDDQEFLLRLGGKSQVV